LIRGNHIGPTVSTAKRSDPSNSVPPPALSGFHNKGHPAPKRENCTLTAGGLVPGRVGHRLTSQHIEAVLATFISFRDGFRDSIRDPLGRTQQGQLPQSQNRSFPRPLPRNVGAYSPETGTSRRYRILRARTVPEPCGWSTCKSALLGCLGAAFREMPIDGGFHSPRDFGSNRLRHGGGDFG
jgi:hypothetical protein